MTLTIRRRLGISLALLLTLLGAGCTDAGDAPLFPGPDGPSLSSGDLDELARFERAPQVPATAARKWIGPAGGRLEFMGFAIDVPAGAVDRSTLFTLRLPVERTGSEHVVAEFGPRSVRFRRPIAIELPYRGTTIEGAASPVVVWWSGDWVPMGGTVTRDGHLRTTTDHFSTYGTTDAARNNGTMVTGGG